MNYLQEAKNWLSGIEEHQDATEPAQIAIAFALVALVEQMAEEQKEQAIDTLARIVAMLDAHLAKNTEAIEAMAERLSTSGDGIMAGSIFVNLEKVKFVQFDASEIEGVPDDAILVYFISDEYPLVLTGDNREAFSRLFRRYSNGENQEALK